MALAPGVRPGRVACAMSVAGQFSADTVPTPLLQTHLQGMTAKKKDRECDPFLCLTNPGAERRAAISRVQP